MFTCTVLQANAARVLPVSEILNLVCGRYLESLDERSAHFRFLSTEDNTNTNTHTHTQNEHPCLEGNPKLFLSVRTVEDTTCIRQRYVQ